MRLIFTDRELFICSSIEDKIAYANETNTVNKDSPIEKFNSKSQPVNIDYPPVEYECNPLFPQSPGTNTS